MRPEGGKAGDSPDTEFDAALRESISGLAESVEALAGTVGEATG
jgi:hypothetical protein